MKNHLTLLFCFSLLGGGVFFQLSLNVLHSNKLKIDKLETAPYHSKDEVNSAQSDFILRPGDLYREYIWILPEGSKDNGFLRLGGKLDYKTNPDNLPPAFHDNGKIKFGQEIDLAKAVKAELLLEKVLSHEGTKGLAIQINDSEWISVPEATNIPSPQWERPHHFRPVVTIPLDYLNEGNNNTIELKVDTLHPWNWPQHLIYGMVLRVYYEKTKAHTKGTIISPVEGEGIRQELHLKTATTDTVQKVDYIGYYEDLNWEGDGLNRQWHQLFHRGELMNNIGTARTPPYLVHWNTDWIPDQSGDIKIIARVHSENGLIYNTPAIEGLKLNRKHNVELVTLDSPPAYWTTRNDAYSSSFQVEGNLAKATAATMAWTSWSPCYDHGVFINGHKVHDGADTPCYDFYQHEVPIDISILKAGTNQLSTAKTPLYDGQMVHGMEVQYPGMQLKIKYEPFPNIIITDGIVDEGQAAFKIETPHGMYYYQKEAGGFSSILDKAGKDWLGFRQTDQASYPASAASDYRGLPNSVFSGDDDGAGHPGFRQCTSVQVASNKIRTFSKSGHWQWSWTFYNEYAELAIERVDSSRAYWFLYEGTPGGHYDPEQQFWATNKTEFQRTTPDYYTGGTVNGNWQWAYFGHMRSPQIFFVAQEESDQLNDLFGYLGNTESGVTSQDGMVVFGLGRGEGAKPLFTKPMRFKIGFHPMRNKSKERQSQVADFLNGLLL